MTREEIVIMGYLAKDGMKEFNGELLPDGDRPLTKIASETNISFDELFEAAKSLEYQNLIRITKVEKEIGSQKIIAVRVEITQEGMNYIKNNPEIFKF